MKTAPIPRDVSKRAGRTLARYVPSTGSCVRSSIPIELTIIPTAATGRTPILGANCEARPADTMIPPVKGRNASPASNGPYPSTRWMYSVLKKNMANTPDATRNMTTFAVNSERIRKIESRTSGAAERCSISTKAVSRTTATAKKPIVVADVQPFVSAWTIA